MRRTLLLVGWLLVGCGSESESTTTVTDTGALADAAVDTRPAVVDSATVDSTDSATACNMLELGTAPKATAEKKTGAAPAPTGGTIADGRYELVRMEAYGSADPPPRREVQVIKGKSTELVFEDGDVVRTGSFTTEVDGTNLVITELCPGSGLFGTSPFSATGTGFSVQLKVGGSTVVLFFEKR